MLNKSLPVDCWRWIAGAMNATVVRKATVGECRFSKAAGLILLLVAAASFVVNIRILKSRRKSQPVASHDQKLIVGMFVSSLCMIIISTPSVLLQCFLCHRLCSALICHIEGFNSFYHGCTTMYMLVALSLIRYATTASSPLSINLKRQIKEHSLLLVFGCFLLGSVWAIPPMFRRVSAYVPEGLGFHCGLDWFDRSLASRVYFFLLFLCVYFIPLAIVISVNVSIHRTIHRLTHLYPSVMLEMSDQTYHDLLRRHVSRTLCERTVQQMQHLHEDRRFVLATGISVVIYLIAWTPYSVMALSQLFGGDFALYKPWVTTTCAILAKLSMIVNPIIYTSLLNRREVHGLIMNFDHSY